MTAESYAAIMDQRAEIMRASVAIDYERYTTGKLAFDYERLMADTGYDIATARSVQQRTCVGNRVLGTQYLITDKRSGAWDD